MAALSSANYVMADLIAIMVLMGNGYQVTSEQQVGGMNDYDLGMRNIGAPGR